MMSGRTEFRVENMTSDPCVDVDIGMDVQSMPYWSSNNNKARPNFRYRCGLKKTRPNSSRNNSLMTRFHAECADFLLKRLLGKAVPGYGKRGFPRYSFCTRMFLRSLRHRRNTGGDFIPP